jgi:NAD(P)-dependent dehydrogenase (short-subunit alcohol dehydrogenase family)
MIIIIPSRERITGFKLKADSRFMQRAVNAQKSAAICLCAAQYAQHKTYQEVFIVMKDFLGYRGKKCVVTGSSSGMGFETAKMLIELEAEVYGLDVVEKATPGLKFFKCDLGNKADIDAVFAKLPAKFDKYFGIAGVSGMRTDFVKTMTINLVSNRYITGKYLVEDERIVENGAVVLCASCAGFHWKKYKHEYIEIFDAECSDWEGQVKILSGMQAHYKTLLTGLHAYSLSKRGLGYFTGLMMKHLGDRGVRINTIGPGSTKTGLSDQFDEAVGGAEKLDKGLLSVIHRRAEAIEMAGPMVFFNSDMATYINGQFVSIDGGCEVDIELHGHVDSYDYPALPVE